MAAGSASRVREVLGAVIRASEGRIMGFTRQWYRKPILDSAKFDRAVSDCSLLAAEYGQRLEDTEFSGRKIQFSGGCEPFEIESVFQGRIIRDGMRKGLGFEFCKTQRFPYDLLVAACQIVFKHHFGDDFIALSDGEDASYGDARRLCQRTLNYGSDFRMDAEAME